MRRNGQGPGPLTEHDTCHACAMTPLKPTRMPYNVNLNLSLQCRILTYTKRFLQSTALAPSYLAYGQRGHCHGGVARLLSRMANGAAPCP